MKKLHESNLRLREKNLQLNQRLHRKTRENVEVRDQLNSLQVQLHFPLKFYTLASLINI